ncbi:MAG: response regulator [Pseudomonadota bacterium]
MLRFSPDHNAQRTREIKSPSLRILVVDDAHLSHRIIVRELVQAGFHDVRQAVSANQALELLTERPADVVIADWVMPGMDGLTLTEMVRARDAHTSHYTYIILITAKDGEYDLANAFMRGIDDFIIKSKILPELVFRIRAASRLLHRHHRLVEDSRLLQADLRSARTLGLQDRVTGLSTLHAAQNHLVDALTEVRAGRKLLIVTLLEVRSEKRQSLEDLPQGLANEICIEMAKRLNQQTRPCDFRARIADHQFLLTFIFDAQQSVDVRSFLRISKAVTKQTFATHIGTLNIKVLSATISLVNNETSVIPKDGARLIQVLQTKLAQRWTTVEINKNKAAIAEPQA